MGLGYVEGITHDYVRHGTTTLFAALDIANGSVLTQYKPRYRHQEFLGFLRHIESNVPAQLDVHRPWAASMARFRATAVPRRTSLRCTRIRSSKPAYSHAI
jgi:hypothetical protein